MNLDQPSGTPPQLWMQFTKSARTVLWRGLLRDQVRIKRLARQVEKLSWMLGWMDDNMHISEPANLENAEEAWKQR